MEMNIEVFEYRMNIEVFGQELFADILTLNRPKDYSIRYTIAPHEKQKLSSVFIDYQLNLSLI